MALDPRIPLLFDNYVELENGVLVNNLDVDSEFRQFIKRRTSKKWNGLREEKNYLTLLDSSCKKIADCYDVIEKSVNKHLFRIIKTKDYTVLTDINNMMVTDRLTTSIKLYDLGGFIGIPYLRIGGYDENNYNIYGYIGKNGNRVKTYSYINAVDFAFIDEYTKEDILATVILEGNSTYIDGYIVESKGDGLISSGHSKSNSVVLGLLTDGELQRFIKQKRIKHEYKNCINKRELTEFIEKTSVRAKIPNANITHATFIKCL